MDFITPSRKARFAQLGYLFKHTFTIFGRERDIVQPIIRMSIYAVVMTSTLFAGILLIGLQARGGGWLLLLGCLLFFYKFFYYNRTGLVLSRLVYATATGGEADAKTARKNVAGLKRQARVLAWLDMASVLMRSRKSGVLLKVLLASIAGIWDLVSHFLLPVFAIDQHGLRDGAAELRSLKDNVPESLAGVFGISIMGRVVGTIMGQVYFFLGVLGVVLGLLFGARMPEAFAFGELGEMFPIPDNWPLIGPHTVFNWLPLLGTIFLGSVIQAILARVVDALKTVYYTLLYTRINHADELSSDMRADLDGYLKLEAGAEGGAPAPAQ